MQDQPYKMCPRCQQPAVLDAPVCRRCGHRYRTQFAPPPLDRTQVFLPPEQTQAVLPGPHRDAGGLRAPYTPPRALPGPLWTGAQRPAVAAIVAMWVLVVASAGIYQLAPALGGLAGAGSIGLAIYLACQKTLADRINGWVVIGLHVLGWVLLGIVVLAAMQNAAPTLTN